MSTGIDLAKAGCRYLGTPYNVLDCQAFVEKALYNVGIKIDLSGSNRWFRKVLSEGWIGTPEDCKKQFGTIPQGAFLFIWDTPSQSTPKEYREDGLGDAEHIGIYTGMSGKEMVSIAKAEGDAIAAGFNFGDGAIHSSYTNGAVCTSRFAGKTINGGWNRIGLWKRIDYGESVNRILRGESSGGKGMYQAKVVGGKLNMREQPQTGAERLCQIPDGQIITVTDEAVEWAKTSYNGYVGWVQKKYLERVDAEQDDVLVNRKELESIYNQIGDWLGLRG